MNDRDIRKLLRLLETIARHTDRIATALEDQKQEPTDPEDLTGVRIRGPEISD